MKMRTDWRKRRTLRTDVRCVVIYLACCALLSSHAISAQRKRATQKPREEASFGVEAPIENPVEIPDAVLRRLAQDEQFQRCYDDIEKRTAKPSMLEWFSAAAVRLDDDARADLVVKAEHPCLLGANIGPFWVFRNAGRGNYSLVLDESTLSLRVLRTRTNGLRDIRTQAASAREVYTSVWKFNGRSYQTKQPRGVTAEVGSSAARQ